MNPFRLFNSRATRWYTLHKTVTFSLLVALLAGLIPPPLVASVLPAPAAELVEAALLPTAPTAQAAPAPAPLAQAVSGSGILTITKSVIGTGSGPFNITVTGPNGYSNSTTVSPGTPHVLTGLATGTYTVTESSPGVSWTTTYTATPGTGGASRAVINLTGPTIAPVTAGLISGNVFRDFDADGVDDGAGEIGVVNVLVTAYDVNGVARGSDTTDAASAYSFTPTGSGPYRIEFSDLPAGYEPSTHGTGNGSSTQFVTTVGASNVNLGINHPADYVDADPRSASPRYYQKLSGFQTLLSWDYDNRGLVVSGSYIAPTGEALISEIGTTWGLAYRRSTKDIFATAFVRRHGSIPDVVSADGTTTTASDNVADLGVIYRVTQDGNSGNNSNVKWVNLDGATDTDSNPIGMGTLGTDSARGINTTGPSNDATAFDVVGKQGLGDIDISDDESDLWVMNLNERKLHAIAIQASGSAGAIRTFDIPTAQCNGTGASSDAQPFAVKYYRNSVYIGVVCSGENTQSLGSMRAYVYQLSDDNTTTTFTQVLTFGLGYARQAPDSTNGCSVAAYQNWQPWRTTIPAACLNNRTVAPQPILSDIEFDSNGDMIMGLMDRYGHQVNVNNYGLSGTTLISSVSAGDILRAPRQSSTLFNVETTATDASITTEYYSGDRVVDTGNGSGHSEITVGGLALIPGNGKVVATAFDPLDGTGAQGIFNAGGVIFLDNSTGTRTGTTDGYQVFNELTNGTVGKAAGMGDVELLSTPAPIEIGNRVWNDYDGDGVQDPGEPGLNGVTVSRQGPTNTVTVNTSGDGNYYFGSLRANTLYTLTIIPTTAQLSGLSLTVANAQALSGASVSSNHAISDTRDSDAALIGGKALIYYSTGSAGQNNHGLDFGFTQPVSGRVGIVNTAPGAIQVSKQVVTSDGSTVPGGLGSFTINVSCPGSTPTPSASQTVAAGASVTFANIAAGTVCTVSENTLTLPTAPSGYSWVNSQLTPSTVTVVSNQTATVTAKNTLAPQPTAGGVLTITKSIIGSGAGPFNITVTGPGGYNNSTTVSPGTPRVLTGLAIGTYTVVESSPGVGWTTTYTATPGTGGSSNAVVNLSGTAIAPVAAGAISGQVFRDFDADGVDDGVNEIGVANVLVTAYDVAGVARGSDTSDAAGDYSFTPTGSGPYRVEFSNLPAGYEPSTHGPSAGSGSNGSSTQFVTTVGASNVNLGINQPCDYCQSDPALAMNMYINGDPLANFGTSGTYTALVTFPYSAVGVNPPPNAVARTSQLGSTWGLAWQRGARRLFASAVVRRHAGLGPDGLDAIYAVTDPLGTPTVSTFVKLGSIGIDVGTIGSNAARELTGTVDFWSRDNEGYLAVGTRGIGDIDLSEDERTLWLVNLNQKSLHSIVIDADNNPGTPPTSADAASYSIPDPGCVNGELRPFGLKVYRGQVYVGAICDASALTLQGDLLAVVYRFDGASFTTVLTSSLVYPKGKTSTLSCCATNTGWYPWISTWPSQPPYWSNYFQGWYGNYPSPILSDIEFDVDGSLIMAFADRFGLQGGWRNIPIDPVPWDLYNTFSGGDILRAYNNNGTYVMENNGSAGPNTTIGAGNGQGIGGGEFYHGDGNNGHDENSDGGVALLPGSGQVVMSGMDPFNPIGGGAYFLDNQHGAKVRGYEVYSQSGFGNNPQPTFAKANGIGDVELLCDPAPIEIGNRVWNDYDSDGVQDPGEPGIANVTVSRQGPTNTVTTSTDANGLYYFASLRANTLYTLTINTLPAGLSLSPANAAALSGASVSSNHAISDTRDSDAVLIGGKALIYYTTGSAGQNNHGLDFGFTQPVKGQVDITNTAPLLACMQFNVTINGSQEAPSNASPATGSGWVQINPATNVLTYSISYAGLTGSESMAHIHGFAPRGTAAGVLFNLPLGSFKSGTLNFSEAQQTDLLAGLAYVNIHTSIFGGGEIRGQIDGATSACVIPPPSYALSKRLITPDPVRVGDDITFTIRITNTGSTVITNLPLSDLYDVVNLFYLTANLPPNDAINDGQLDWSDLTASFGQDLAPNASFAVNTVFVARSDTSGLSGGATVNTARVLITPTTTVTAPVRIEAPTAVDLAEHSATYDLRQGVTLRWTTVSEAQAVGFHLLRREPGNGGWVQLNAALIPAQQPGQATGASYTFSDADAQFGHTYLYLVEIMDASGTASRRELGLVVAGSRALLPLVAR